MRTFWIVLQAVAAAVAFGLCVFIVVGIAIDVVSFVWRTSDAGEKFGWIVTIAIALLVFWGIFGRTIIYNYRCARDQLDEWYGM